MLQMQFDDTFRIFIGFLLVHDGKKTFQHAALDESVERHCVVKDRVKHPLRKRQSPREMSYLDVVIWDIHTGAILQT